MTKTNFSAKTQAVSPRQRNIHGKQAPAGFAEILDQRSAPARKPPPEPAATIKPRREPKDDPAIVEIGPLEGLRGPTGTVIADLELRPAGGMQAVEEGLAKQTLPYARTGGSYVRIPTFAELGSEAPDAPATQLRATSDDPWLPPAPSWGQSQGPEPELVQTPPGEEILATAAEGGAEVEGEIELIELGWQALEPDADPMIDLEEALGAFEMALTVEDDASSLDEDAANYAPIPDFDETVETPRHSPSFLSATPTIAVETAPTYGAHGNVLTAADPTGPTRNIEVFRTALNRAAITVDTDDGQIELAITTAGKHVMVEATAANGFTDAIQRDLAALRSALERHELELTELSFGDSGTDANTDAGAGGSEDSRRSAKSRSPKLVSGTEHGEPDVGFSDDGRQTWVVPTGFRVVA